MFVHENSCLIKIINNMIECTINGKSAALNLSNEQLQVLVSGKFGDGCLSTPKTCMDNSMYSTNCIHKEYIDYKEKLLGDLASKSNFLLNNGYAKKPIWCLHTHVNPDITTIKNMNIEDALSLLDDLGIALWFYDDGSLHKTKLFYNLNTQGFSEEVNKELFVPFFLKFGIKAKPTIERKKDGREFWYLRVGKYDGAYEISELLNKYKVNCFNYKVWSSETIQNWSKLQEWLKSGNNSNCSTKKKSMILKKIEQGEL